MDVILYRYFCVMVACGNTTANELVYEEQEEKLRKLCCERLYR